MDTKDNSRKFPGNVLARTAPAALFALWSVVFAWVLWAEPAAIRTFASPAEASKALFHAAQAGDTAALMAIFGADGKEIVFSGDPAEDKNNRDRFVEKYQQMTRLVEEADGTVWLYVGAENWPMPVPLTHKGNRWYFNTAAGKDEILFRRIGQNEIAAMQAMQELVAAEKEYYSQARDDGPKQYAPHFFSDGNKHDGLFWQAAAGGKESFIGLVLADAGKDLLNTRPSPFYGYYFRVLTSQGRNAAGGTKDYIVDGKMTGGFAFIAYPAEYGNSGIMSFAIDQDGTLYQKDLGRDTAKLAEGLSQYDPDQTWSKVE